MDFVFGPYSSANTAAIAPIIDKHGYPTLASGATSDALWRSGYRNLFGVYSPASRYAMGFLALIAEAGIQRVAIISAADAFSVEASNGMRTWAPQYALQVASFATVSKDHAEVLRAAQGAQRSGAQALLVAGHFNEAVDVRKALKQIGWTPSAYYATVGPAVDRYAQLLGDDAEGAFSTSVWEPREDLRFSMSPQFLQQFVVDLCGNAVVPRGDRVRGRPDPRAGDPQGGQLRSREGAPGAVPGRRRQRRRPLRGRSHRHAGQTFSDDRAVAGREARNRLAAGAAHGGTGDRG